MKRPDVIPELPEPFKRYAGPPWWYDIIGALQFGIMVGLGMREKHTMLDIGCGPLRGGRFYIPYLGVGNYVGIEPRVEVLQVGIEEQGLWELIEQRQARFYHFKDFRLDRVKQDYDYIIAQSVFSHTPMRHMRTCWKSIAKVLKLDGVCAATYFPGEKDYAGNVWTNVPVAHYRPDTLRELAKVYGLIITFQNWWHPGGQGWFTLSKQPIPKKQYMWPLNSLKEA